MNSENEFGPLILRAEESEPIELEEVEDYDEPTAENDHLDNPPSAEEFAEMDIDWDREEA